MQSPEERHCRKAGIGINKLPPNCDSVPVSDGFTAGRQSNVMRITLSSLTAIRAVIQTHPPLFRGCASQAFRPGLHVNAAAASPGSCIHLFTGFRSYPAPDCRELPEFKWYTSEPRLELELQHFSYSVCPGENDVCGSKAVNTLLVKLRLRFLELVEQTDGQDIVEYVLVFALLALGATTATKFLATGLAGAFNGISTTMASYTS